MEKEQLYQNLYELEKQLKGIQSATTRVNQVVEGQNAMMTSVGKFLNSSQGYVSELKKTCEEYEKKFYDLTHNSFEKTNASFSTECTSLSEGVRKNLEAANQGFQNSTATLTEKVRQQLDAANESFAGKATALKEEYRKSLTKLADGFTQKIQESSENIDRISVSMDDLIVKHLQPMVTVELPDLLDKKLKPFIDTEMKERLDEEIQKLDQSSSDIIKGFEEKLKELDVLQQHLLKQSAFVKEQLTSFSEKVQQILDMNQATYLEEIGGAEKRLKETTEALKTETTSVSQLLDSKSELLTRDIQTLDHKAQEIGMSIEALEKKFAKSLTDMSEVVDGVATAVHTKTNNLEKKIQNSSEVLKEEMTTASAQLGCNIGAVDSKVNTLEQDLHTFRDEMVQTCGHVKGMLTVNKKYSDQQQKRIEEKMDQQLQELSEEIRNGNKKMIFIFLGMAFIILFQLVLLVK